MGRRRDCQDAHRHRSRQAEGHVLRYSRRRPEELRPRRDGPSRRGLQEGERSARRDQQRPRDLVRARRPHRPRAPPAPVPDAQLGPRARGVQVPKHDSAREQAPDGSRRNHQGDSQRAHVEAPLPHRHRGHRRRPRPAFRPHQLRRSRPRGGWRSVHRPTRRIRAGHHATDPSLAQLVG